ncbi:Pycsar system effector family protein [Cryptosporangium aurantiacum]|uniref:Pycsar effector protein domain-containing protein n=1 Tax=Cryptosporangium aurantiacum TaxID=134849 RepID=A0A1M7RPU6_9ACTN|nr:Pycsar system effector family protein [Cryptosporangium aurantiacum]SHN48200.1 hypothetical protein SAMN05443668_13618 [Cryptosporangium aurantiacum]
MIPQKTSTPAAMVTATGPTLTTCITEVTGELSRADQKAATLLALTGAAAAGAVSALTPGDGLPMATRVLGWAAVAGLAVAVLILTTAIRPQLALRGGPNGIVAWATADPAELVDGGPVTDPAARLVSLSGLAVAKYRRVRRAVACIVGAVALLALAAVAALVAAVAG